uniref:Uncharacterized protein n=1 Tax=Haemonchus contortus TaxID=6289 RepID=A0A7I5E7L4_HAECO
MLHLRVFVLTIMLAMVFNVIAESDRVIRSGPLYNAFNVPFRVIGKRNQFYGLFKKLNYESSKPF